MKRNSLHSTPYILGLTVFLISNLVYSQTYTWQPTNGPYGGTVRAFAVNSSNQIFAGTAGGGVFRSINGENWESVNNGITNYTVRALAINNNDDIFAGTFGGVFRSTNNGEIWSQINNGLNNSLIYSLTTDNDDNILASGTGGIFRSEDNGDTWSAINTELGSGVRTLITYGDSMIFAGTVLNGAFRSMDNGDTWEEINNGMINGSVNAFVIIDSTDTTNNLRLHQPEFTLKDNPAILIIGSGSGAFISTDFGSSSSPINFFNSNFIGVNALIYSKSTSTLTAATPLGVYNSAEDFVTWNETSIKKHSLALGIRGEDEVFVGTQYEGVERSTDNGATSEPVIYGMTGSVVNVITKSGGNKFAGTAEAYYSNDNLEENWNPVEPIFGFVHTAAVAPNGNMLVGVDDKVFLLNGDGENVINITYNLPPFGTVNGFAFDADGKTYAAGSNGIHLLNEEVTAWLEKLTNIYCNDITFDPAHSFIWAVGFDFVSRSEDGGDTWNESKNGIPPNTDVKKIRHLNNKQVALTSVGPFEFDFDNDLWSQMSDFPPNLATNDMIYLENYGFIAATSNGIWSNSGDSWSQLPNNENKLNHPVNTLASIQSPFNKLSFTDVSSDDIVLAGTGGAGIYWLQLPAEQVGVDEMVVQLPESFGLSQNYPNPLNPSTKINYSIPQTSFVKLKVYNILGKEIETLVNEEKPAGNYEVEFYANDLSSGVYFYRLEAGGFSDTKKFILLR
jgi:photosystem II stability/assembly factor-like uncharacterized protein